jgi:glycosyltransferase involved in cell wall biosynthesis
VKDRRKILGIDASRSTRTSPTGVERYSDEIIQAILEELGVSGNTANDDWKVRLYTPIWLDKFPRNLQRRIRLPRLWTLLRLSLEMLLHKPDALFIPAHVIPFFAPRDTYVTVHDVAFEKYPMAYGAFASFYLAWSTKRALRKARKVIVPTESVRHDLKKYYEADGRKIMVVNHGRLPLAVVTEQDIEAALQHYRLGRDEKIFFFIGRLETKKNLMVLLNAWEIVQKKCSEEGLPAGRLFLGGMYGHGFNDLFRRMEDDDLRGTVLAPGYISEYDASGIFNAATAFVMPSREEGFGLPILQSFEADCAVICSDIPPLREVAGDAALYADPGKAEDFAEQMLKLMKDDDLKDKLVDRGKKRLEQFSWKRAAEQLVEEFSKN